VELLSFTPQTVKSHWLPMQEARVLPIGDIQFGSSTDVDRLQRYIEWGQKHQVYYVGMGDYVDCASPSNRKLLTGIRGSLYDSVRLMMDERVGQYVEEVWELLKPTKGRWLGLLRGHHTWEFEDGTSTESRLAERLKCPMLGDCAVMILRFRRPVGVNLTGSRKGGIQGAQNLDVKLWLHHGTGGGTTEGAALNRLSQITRTMFANVYIMAHTHQRAAKPIPWIDFKVGSSGSVRSTGTTRYLVLAGSWLKAYDAGSTNPRGEPAGSYVEQKMLNPLALGAPLIMMRPVWSERRVDVTVNV
jgi:hypothetical protein